MPNSGLHLCLAEHALDHWRRGGGAPFDVPDERAAELFLFAAVPPDVGFLPGGRRQLSELAHRVRTADLPRALPAAAESGAQQAYAWGWTTHVPGDVENHPLIDGATSDRDRSYDTEVALHMRLEYGLDHYIFVRVATQLERFGALLDEHVRAVADLRNVDLFTGEPESAPAGGS